MQKVVSILINWSPVFSALPSNCVFHKVTRDIFPSHGKSTLYTTSSNRLVWCFIQDFTTIVAITVLVALPPSVASLADPVLMVPKRNLGIQWVLPFWECKKWHNCINYDMSRIASVILFTAWMLGWFKVSMGKFNNSFLLKQQISETIHYSTISSEKSISKSIRIYLR